MFSGFTRLASSSRPNQKIHNCHWNVKASRIHMNELRVNQRYTHELTGQQTHSKDKPLLRERQGRPRLLPQGCSKVSALRRPALDNLNSWRMTQITDRTNHPAVMQEKLSEPLLD